MSYFTLCMFPLVRQNNLKKAYGGYMKRFFAFLISAMVLLSSFAVFATTEEYHFYIKRAKDHAKPQTDPRFSALLDDGCFYLDNTSTDEEKRLYLTFDAGYENGNVEKILDILKEEKVPAAFFVLSHLIRSESALVSRMAEEGHLVCNHTARHKNMAKADSEHFRSELLSLEQIYKEETGKELSKFYRPPEGTFSFSNIQTAKSMGYKTVFWSLAYKDWNDEVAPSPEKAIALLKENTHPGAIVLLHPTSSVNATILREMIAYWRNEGYTLCSLEEMR